MREASKAKLRKDKFVAEITEEYINKVGAFGRYQKLYILVIQLVTWHYCGNFMFLAYAGLPATFTCATEPNQTAVSEESDKVCDLLQRCPHGLTAKEPLYFRTLTDEWPEEVVSYCVDGLSTRFLSPPKTLITFVVLAAGVSVIPAGISTDLFGRRKMLLSGALGATVLGCVSAFQQSITAVTVVYISAVVVSTFAALPALSLCSEYTSRKFRLIMNLCTTWFTAFLIAAFVGWLTQDWRRYLIVFNTLGMPLAASLWFFNESPRWLLINKRFVEAARVLNHIARINRSDVTITAAELEKRLNEFEKVLHDHEPADAETPQRCAALKDVLSDLLRIFKNRDLRPVSLLLIFYQFGSAGLSVTFNFNLEHSAYSPFFTVAMLGLLRIWSPCVLALLELKVKNFRRRSFFCLGIMLVLVPMTSALVFSIIAASTEDESHRVLFRRMFTIMHTISIATNFGFLWFIFTQTSIEVFPTVIRSAAMATLHMSTTIGGALGPLLLRMQRRWEPSPHLVLGVWIWVVLFLGLAYYPETKGKNLPDTFDDLRFVFHSENGKEGSVPPDSILPGMTDTKPQPDGAKDAKQSENATAKSPRGQDGKSPKRPGNRSPSARDLESAKTSKRKSPTGTDPKSPTDAPNFKPPDASTVKTADD